MKNYAVILVVLFTITAQGQKPHETCEFVALVNKDVITRSAYLATLKDYKEELTRQMQKQGKTDAEIDVEFERTKSVVLNNLIDNLLLEQRAEEMRLEDDADTRKIIGNPALLIHPGYRDDFGFPSVAFEETLKNQDIDIEQSRNQMRKQILRQAVIQKEVLAPIYQSITDEDRRSYYKAHKEELMHPARVSLSEIFLPLDGYSETEVEHRASNLLVRLRAGADFIKAVKENTPVSRTSYAAEGYLGSFALDDLRESVLMAISSLKSGEFTEPVRLDKGYMIIRLDTRIPSTAKSYDEPEVQQAITRAITLLRGEEARKNYIAELRKNAQIRICSGR